MIFRSVASWIKPEPQEIAIPNIPASEPSTRQKTSTRKGKPSAFAKPGIHQFMVYISVFGHEFSHLIFGPTNPV